MPSNFFDFVIVGGDLPGVIFAALAAKRGKRVAVIENGEGRAWDVVRGRPLPLVVPWIYGVETSPLIRGVLGEIDIFLQVRNRLVRGRPSLQLIGEHARVDLGELDDLGAELARELGEERARADLDWVQKLQLLDGDLSQIIERKPLAPPDSWGERRELGRILDDFPLLKESLEGSPFDRPTHLLPFLKAYVPFVTLAYQAPFAAAPFLRVAKGLLDGVALLDDDEDPDFRRFFLDVVRRKSGVVVTDAQVSGMDVRRGRVNEVFLKGGKESLGGEVVLCNMDPRRFLQLIPPEAQKEKYHQQILMRRPAGYLYPLALRLRGDRFLEGAGSLMLFDPAWVQHPMIVHVPRQQPASGDETVVLVMTWVPGAELTLQESFLARLERRVLDALGRIHPFVEDLLIEAVRLGVDEAGALVPGRFLSVYPLVEERNVGLNDLLIETPYKNVLVASRYLYAGLVLEGSFLGARLLADRLLKP